jgi:hypothetical protein
VTVIDLPLTATDAPGLYVQVDLWQQGGADFNSADYFDSAYSRRDGDLLSRSLSIPIIDPDRQLQLSVLEIGAANEAGQTAVTLQVVNGRGEPVAAEVALSIASQSLYSHFPNHNRPQYDYFFRQAAVSHTLYHSLAPQRDLSYQFFGGCGCGGGWWGNIRLPGLVDDMPSFWFPGLQTDYNGQVMVLVSLPPNPDGWRFSVQAITADGQVGEAVVNN